jgi:hypothetical protein
MTETTDKLQQYVLSSEKPAALYSKSRLQKVKDLDFDKAQLDNFYKENDVLRQFYGVKNIPKKKISRNGYACYPLERIHIDLCEMTKKQGDSKFKYILFAIDNFSRYVFFVHLATKQAGEMGRAATNLLLQMKKFRRLGFNTKSIFLSDLGTEFITTFKKVLLEKGHSFVNLATSESKAFYAERFIRTFRTLLKVKQTALDLNQESFECWDKLTKVIVDIYNSTPHKSLGYVAPESAITLSKSMVKQTALLKPSFTKTEFLKSLDAIKRKVPFKVGDYVNITLTRKNTFSKGSEQLRVGLEIFQIIKIRPPILDQSKLSYYFLKDLTGKAITGAFYESNLILIPTTSRRHPENPDFKKTIAKVVSVRKVKKKDLYKVTYNGELFFIIIFTEFFQRRRFVCNGYGDDNGILTDPDDG